MKCALGLALALVVCGVGGCYPIAFIDDSVVYCTEDSCPDDAPICDEESQVCLPGECNEDVQCQVDATANPECFADEDCASLGFRCARSTEFGRCVAPLGAEEACVDGQVRAETPAFASNEPDMAFCGSPDLRCERGVCLGP